MSLLSANWQQGPIAKNNIPTVHWLWRGQAGAFTPKIYSLQCSKVLLLSFGVSLCIMMLSTGPGCLRDKVILTYYLRSKIPPPSALSYTWFINKGAYSLKLGRSEVSGVSVPGLEVWGGPWSGVREKEKVVQGGAWGLASGSKSSPDRIWWDISQGYW